MRRVRAPNFEHTSTPLRILQVNTADLGGGADRVAWNLFHGCRHLGHDAHMAVGRKCSDDPRVLVIPNEASRPALTRGLRKLSRRLETACERVRGAYRLSRVVQWLAEPVRQLDISRGIEEFHAPGSHRLLNLTPHRPHLIHCHNLHRGYFDLNILPRLSRAVPVVLTLHDAWLLSGHCAHSFGCERWERGCGSCPDLSIYPSVQRDATNLNWRRKRFIFASSRLHVCTPCQWLMEKVRRSILAPAMVEARVIPNGIDLNIFKPAHKPPLRAELDIAPDARIVMFAAAGIRTNPWKDYETMRQAVSATAQKLTDRPLVFLAVGEAAPAQQMGAAQVRFVPFDPDPASVARYYQAADVYLHASRADTFPNAVLEALGCGLPVVATSVGGIPEQVDEGRTGFLVAPGDVAAMARRLVALLSDDTQRHRISGDAARTARDRFDGAVQVKQYGDWYGQIMGQPTPGRAVTRAA